MYNSNIYNIVAELAKEQGNYSIVYQCNHESALQEHYQEQAHKQLVKEIADEVLSRISLSCDTSDVILKIKQLNDTINQLGQ